MTIWIMGSLQFFLSIEMFICEGTNLKGIVLFAVAVNQYEQRLGISCFYVILYVFTSLLLMSYLACPLFFFLSAFLNYYNISYIIRPEVLSLSNNVSLNMFLYMFGVNIPCGCIL